jgi:hypothetical protein
VPVNSSDLSVCRSFWARKGHGIHARTRPVRDTSVYDCQPLAVATMIPPARWVRRTCEPDGVGETPHDDERFVAALRRSELSATRVRPHRAADALRAELGWTHRWHQHARTPVQLGLGPAKRALSSKLSTARSSRPHSAGMSCMPRQAETTCAGPLSERSDRHLFGGPLGNGW